MMLKRITLILSATFFLTDTSIAQQMVIEHPTMKFYSKSANEFIFSWANCTDLSSEASSQVGAVIDADPIVRFSAVVNTQEQFHYDFTNNFGFFTGIGVRNVGFISNLFDGTNTIKVKYRQYALGVPAAIKFGSMNKNLYLAVGAEMELFFNYKKKVYYNDTKTKFSEWFSDRSKLFNPSLFAEFNFKQGQFIRFRYYLNDFLTLNKDGVTYGNSQEAFPYDGTPSQLMYISIGTSIDWDDFKREKGGSMKASLN